MHMFFLDESGSAPAASGQDKYFVIAGLIVPETSWRNLRDGLEKLKQGFGVKGEIKWRYFFNTKNDGKNTLLHLDQANRDSFRAQIFALIEADKDVQIIGVVTCVEAAYALPNIRCADDLYECTYKPATERFQYYLQDQQVKTRNEENGIIICDQRNKFNDRRLLSLHQQLLNRTALNASKYPNLIENLFIVPSHLSVGIQLADLVAGAIYRRFERNDPTFIKMIPTSFRRNQVGEVHGFGIVKNPKRGWK